MTRAQDARLYIIGPWPLPGRTHLAVVQNGEVFQLCLPNIPVEAGWDCKSNDSFPAGREEAEEWDKYYSEVTCQTCLKRAAGRPSAQAVLL